MSSLDHVYAFDSMGTTPRYNLSFSAASLRVDMARILAETYLDTGDWSVARQKILLQNALQARMQSSNVRMEREIRQRVQLLTVPQIEILAKAPSDSRVAIAWLSMLKSSAFVFEFAAEVLRAKLQTMDTMLRPSDYEAFHTAKSAGHPELASLTPASQAKVKQVLLTMLREVGILAASGLDNRISRPVIPHDVLAAILADDRRWLAGFLVPDAEILSTRG
jgi:hypothetical protein